MTAEPVSRASEGSLWLDRLERGLRDEEGEALRAWLAVAENRSFLLSQARIGRGPDVVAVLARLYPESPELKAPRKRRHALNVAALWAGAASIVVAAYFAFNGRAPWSFDLRTASDGRFVREIYATGPNETRRITLPDGSLMTLNSGTQLEVFYWPHSRHVGMLKGEASFQVPPVTDRPFTVSVGARVFAPEGEAATTFDIRVLATDTLELAVTDGRVTAFYSPTGYLETPADARLRDESVRADTVARPLDLVRVERGLQFMRTLGAAELQQRLAWLGSVKSSR